MARIAGINIPDRQHTEIGLTAIYGIGRTRARQICEAANIPFSKRVKDLNDASSSGFASRSVGSRSRAICAAKSPCRSSG